MKNVLWLASWYPNRMDKYDGDFIQRHARAVSLYCNVYLIYVVKCKNKYDETFVDKKVTGNLTELTICYRSFKTGLKLLDRFISQLKYKSLYKKAIYDYINVNGKPQLMHVHVAMKAGLVALWAFNKWQIPFIVSEHWTGYLSEADISIDDFSSLYLKKLRQILVKASIVTVVSDHLGKAIQDHLPFVKYRVVPNVVDTDIFFPIQKQVSDRFKIIHASNMNYQKNTKDILQALQILKQKEPNFQMQLFGRAEPVIQQLILKLGLQTNIVIKGELPQTELAKAMQQADVLILYSRFETFGCVLIEANACGIPVIVSDIKVFHELVEENVNGIFVKTEDPVALANAIFGLTTLHGDSDHSSIAAKTAEKYCFSTVGKQFKKIYSEIGDRLEKL